MKWRRLIPNVLRRARSAIGGQHTPTSSSPSSSSTVPLPSSPSPPAPFTLPPLPELPLSSVGDSSPPPQRRVLATPHAHELGYGIIGAEQDTRRPRADVNRLRSKSREFRRHGQTSETVTEGNRQIRSRRTAIVAAYPTAHEYAEYSPQAADRLPRLSLDGSGSNEPTDESAGASTPALITPPVNSETLPDAGDVQTAKEDPVPAHADNAHDSFDESYFQNLQLAYPPVVRAKHSPPLDEQAIKQQQLEEKRALFLDSLEYSSEHLKRSLSTRELRMPCTGSGPARPPSRARATTISRLETKPPPKRAYWAREPPRRTILYDGRCTYVTLGQLGKGGYGTVFHARTKALYFPLDPALPTHVAIKAFHKVPLRKDGVAILHLVDEINALRRVTEAETQSPFLMHMISAFQDNDCVYIVMDLYGEDLEDSITSVGRRMTTMEIRFYAAELLLAIEALHSLGIVHRDIKPQNVFVSASGHICLADFSVAAVLPAGARPALHDTLLHGTVGTPCYAAPEQLGTKAVYTYKVDIWGYGLTLLELFLGRRDSKSYFTQYARDGGAYDIRTKDIAADLRRYVDSVAAQNLLSKLLSRDPTARPTIAEIKAHPYFNVIDWEKLAAGGYDAMHRPRRPEEDGYIIIHDYTRSKLHWDMKVPEWMCPADKIRKDALFLGRWDEKGRPCVEEREMNYDALEEV